MVNGLIFDFGASTGDDVDYYLRKGFRVVAVEPCAADVAKLRQRFAAEAASGRLILREVAIGSMSGRGTFYVHDKVEGWHRAAIDPNHPSSSGLSATTVDFTDAASFLREYDTPYYMKIDIEGADHLVVEALTPECKPDFVSFEANDRNEQCISHLVRLGYRSFQIVDQWGLEKTTEPFPAREGLYAGATFTYHMSGLFGRDLPNAWQQPAAALQQARTLDAAGNHWYDLHASLQPSADGRLIAEQS